MIERRGTGGGNFRAMYSRFLDEVGREEDARLAGTASDAWTGLAEALRAASERDAPEPDLWAQTRRRGAEVLEAEERLWEALA